MKTIICGSRNITEMHDVETAMAEAIGVDIFVSEIVSGGARGVDTLGETLAAIRGIPCKVFPAEWDKYGRSAGYRRNEQMAKYADACIAVWDGSSKGTKHMFELMRKLGKPVHVMTVS